MLVNLILVSNGTRKLIQLGTYNVDTVKTTKLILKIIKDYPYLKHHIRKYGKGSDVAIIIYNIKYDNEIKSLLKNNNFGKKYAQLLDENFYVCADNFTTSKKKYSYQIKLDVIDYKYNKYGGGILAQMCTKKNIEENMLLILNVAEKYKKILYKINIHLNINLVFRLV